MNGKIISSHGYVKLLMPEHPSADSKGYVYEHRIVMERKVGRPLKKGEIVHHVDGNKQNNADANLILVNGNSGHYVHHRKKTNLRMPGEPNPIVSCACGCGTTFYKYDSAGRPRKYISGHNHISRNNKGRYYTEVTL